MLVVDAQDAIVEVLTIALRHAGFEVASATSGPGAVVAALVFKADLVIVDVSLPDVDGFSVVARLRGPDGGTPIVFSTARHGVEDSAQDLVRAGDGWLHKPFALEEAVDRVRTGLDGAGGGPAPRLTPPPAGL